MAGEEHLLQIQYQIIRVCCASWEDLCPLGGVPLDDTTVEQSLEHLIVTRWRTSDRPAHAGNALPDFVQAGRAIVCNVQC